MKTPAEKFQDFRQIYFSSLNVRFIQAIMVIMNKNTLNSSQNQINGELRF